MGWDISYHPLAEEEIQSIYVDALRDGNHGRRLQRRFGLDRRQLDRLEECLQSARAVDGSASFQEGHAFHLAIISGCLRRYHYIRGGALSFMADDGPMRRYISDWSSLLPARLHASGIHGRLTGNRCGGVYLSVTSLRALRQDYYRDAHVRGCMDEVFSQGRLAVFWQALDDAVGQGLGLIEASEVVQPNPFNLTASRSLAVLENCERAGQLLYAQAAARQLGAALEANRDKLPLLDPQVPAPLRDK